MLLNKKEQGEIRDALNALRRLEGTYPLVEGHGLREAIRLLEATSEGTIAVIPPALAHLEDGLVALFLWNLEPDIGQAIEPLYGILMDKEDEVRDKLGMDIYILLEKIRYARQGLELEWTSGQLLQCALTGSKARVLAEMLRALSKWEGEIYQLRREVERLILLARGEKDGRI